jgi:hypothetical protein
MTFIKTILNSLRNAESADSNIANSGADVSRRRFLQSSAGLAGSCLALHSQAGMAEDQDKKTSGGVEVPSRVPNWIPDDPPNTPVGKARGIYPGRVVWARDTAATPWSGKNNDADNWWYDNTGVNQAAVDAMISRSLQALTGTKSDHSAWSRIFHHYNHTHGSEDRGYSTGELLALKVNCNNCYAGYADIDDQIDASPQSILAMLRQLVHHAAIPQNKILVYEAIRVIPDRIYNPCHADFPGVLWMDSRGDGTNGRLPVNWRKATLGYSVTEKNACGSSIPELVYQSAYLINMALMKGHPTCGFTLTAKNHYGSIDERDHSQYINTHEHKMGIYNPFVDLIATKHLGGKTILFMIDALFGTRDANDPVTPEFAAWTNLFDGQWSSSFLMSFDPVAIDSVGLDFLRSEFGGYLVSSHGRGHDMHADNYLHEAALADKAFSGTVYKPDGFPVGSLGVHEHWNNPKDKKYSRNLSANGSGIELTAV